MIVITNNYLQLDFTLVAKILGSSGLTIDTELQVLHAAHRFVSHNYSERSKFAKDLLLKVRLPLLSDHVLNYISSRNKYFNEIDDCVEVLREVSQNNKSIYQKKSKTFFSYRFCRQDMFNIIVNGGYMTDEHGKIERVLTSTQLLSGKNFKVLKNLERTAAPRYSRSVYCRGEIYLIGGELSGNYVSSIQKYSLTTNSWEYVAIMFDPLSEFCSCVFLNQIFIIGGVSRKSGLSHFCTRLDTKRKKWRKVAKMSEVRFKAGCSVFEGRIVVCGGANNDNDYGLNTVEAFDHKANAWSSMPNMIGRRFDLDLVSVRNKLFVVSNRFGSLFGGGPENCEVFDSTSNKFVYLKMKPTPLKFHTVRMSLSVGNKLVILGCRDSATALCYDAEKEEWSEELNQITQNMGGFSCCAVPEFTI